MIKTVCKNCGETVVAPDGQRGHRALCKGCGMAVWVGGKSEYGHVLGQGRASVVDKDGEGISDTLAFCLGFFLSLLGVLLATVAGKGRGLRQSLVGFAVSSALFVFLRLLVAIL